MVRLNKLLAIICVFVLFVSCASCASSSGTGSTLPAAANLIVPVQRGDLVVSVSVDGNLEMPQAFNLSFKAPGNVEDVFVEEGDFVRAGTILAALDSSSQQLAVKSANSSLQKTLSDIYETIPSVQQTFMYFPSYYPNVSVLLSFGWSQGEVSRARDLFSLGKYDEAASELRMAVKDLESCEKIFQDTLESPPLSGLAEMAPYANLVSNQQFPTGTIYILDQLKKFIDLFKQGQADLEKVQTLITQGNYVEAGSILEDISSRMEGMNRKLTDDIVNKVEVRYDMSYPGESLCLYFYGSAEEKLDGALDLIKKGKLNSAEYNECLYSAEHYMEICNSIMGGNVLVLEHGLSLKDYRQYNINLARDVVSLGNRQDDLLNTIIIAPFDGTVVSVGVKKNDVLSNMNFSSTVAIQLVDTTAIKFEGQVDEIDILKIKTWQKATVAVDAVSGKEFTGTVKFISPSGSAGTGNVVKFDVTIELDPSDVELKGGLTATADIAVYTAEDVLLVPLTAVTTTPEGSSVMVVSQEGAEPEERQVTLGKQNFQFAEVLSGLEEGDKVLIKEQAISGAPPVITAPPGPPGGGGPPRR